jgi:predicted dehydrogenase
METRRIGIIMNGVTGRMGTNQHLIRSIKAIRDQGGLKVSNDLTLMPDPILTGRNHDKLKALAERTGVTRYTTDIDAALANKEDEIFFDASGTLQRAGFVEKAVAVGKAIYCEKPTAVETSEALRLAKLCEDAGVKNGVVQDKLWLSGIRKFRTLRDQGYFGRILSVRGEFGYWVFTGEEGDQPAQRPSWNYRKEDGGGIIVDMLCHWRYVVDNLFGKVKAVSCIGATHLPKRIDEHGKPYACTSDDACYATFECEGGVICQFNSSWTVRCSPCRSMAPTAAPSWACANAGCRASAPPRARLGTRTSTSPSTSSAAGRKCRTPRPTTTPSRSSGRHFSSTSCSIRPSPGPCARGPKACSLQNSACKAGSSANGCQWVICELDPSRIIAGVASYGIA